MICRIFPAFALRFDRGRIYQSLRNPTYNNTLWLLTKSEVIRYKLEFADIFICGSGIIIFQTEREMVHP